MRLDPTLAERLRLFAATHGKREGQVVADALHAWMDARDVLPKDWAE